MELSHFSIALRNKQLLRNTNDIVLTSLQSELLEFIGGFRELFNLALKDHTNLSYNKHQQLFKLLDKANKKYKESQTIQDSTEDEDCDIATKHPKHTLCSLNDICLSHMFTFLSLHSHRRLQRTCITLTIVGSMRASFLCHDDMIEYGLFPHFIHHINALNIYHALDTHTTTESDTQTAIRSLNSLHDTLEDDASVFGAQLCQSGHLSTLINTALNTTDYNVLAAVMSCIRCLSKRHYNCWILSKCKVFQLIQYIFDNKKLTAHSQPSVYHNAVVTLIDFVQRDTSYRTRIQQMGILDTMTNDMQNWTNRKLIADGLHLIVWLLPSKIEYCATQQKTNVEICLNIVTKIIIHVQNLVLWLYDEQWTEVNIAHDIALQLAHIFRHIHQRHFNIDFDKLQIMGCIHKIVQMGSLETIDYVPDFKYTLLYFIECNWCFVDIFNEEIQNVYEKCDELFLGKLLQMALDSKVNIDCKIEGLCAKEWVRNNLESITYSADLAIVMFPLIVMRNDQRTADLLKHLTRYIVHAPRDTLVRFVTKENMDRLMDLYNDELQTLSEMETISGFWIDEFREIKQFICLFADIIRACMDSDPFSKENDLYSWINVCKLAIVSFWNSKHIVDYIQFEFESNWKTSVFDIVNESLIVGGEMHEMFIVHKRWLIKKVIRLATNGHGSFGTKIANIVLNLLCRLCYGSNKELRLKLIGLDVIPYLNRMLIAAVKYDRYMFRDIVKLLRCLLECAKDDMVIMADLIKLQKVLMKANDIHSDKTSNIIVNELITDYMRPNIV